jgi:hypothetical protein
MLVDGFPVFTGQKKGGTNYSGKYRRAGFKFQMITTLSGIPIHLSKAFPANVHDSAIYPVTHVEHGEWELVLGDKAYLSQAHCVVPPKKNQAIAKNEPEKVAIFTAWHRLYRSKVEHCFAKLHRFRFMKYSYLRKFTPQAVRLLVWCEHVVRAKHAKLRRTTPGAIMKRRLAKRGKPCRCQFNAS